MQNYWSQSPAMFETTEEEIKKLKFAWNYELEKFNRNLEKIRHYFWNRQKLTVIDFTIRHVPEKRSNWDNAKLLCLKLSNGKFLAKRHNNSQWLFLEF